MTSSYTTNRTIEKPAHNDYVDDWELPVNSNMDIIDGCLGNLSTINATAAATSVAVTLTQYRCPMWKITGAPSNAVQYVIPTGIGGIYAVTNSTTGGYAISVASGGGGATIAIPAGKTLMIYCDGTNAGNAMTNAITVDGSATVIANIPMGGFKLTGLLAGTDAADSVRKSQITVAYGKVKLSANYTTLPNTAWTKLPLNTTIADNSSPVIFNTSTNQLVPVTTAPLCVSYKSLITAGVIADGIADCAIYKNNGAFDFGITRNSVIAGVSPDVGQICGGLAFDPAPNGTTDYYDLRAIAQTSGGNATVQAIDATSGQPVTYMSWFTLLS